MYIICRDIEIESRAKQCNVIYIKQKEEAIHNAMQNLYRKSRAKKKQSYIEKSKAKE
jgi:uncharacterized C2H2 Zn-finger protein